MRPDVPFSFSRNGWIWPGAGVLMAGRGGALENRRDLFNLVKLARGDLHDQIVGLVISERQATAVQPVEGNHRREPEPFVAVDQGMVACQGVQQRGCLLPRRSPPEASHLLDERVARDSALL
jgi:hypothetical protein